MDSLLSGLLGAIVGGGVLFGVTVYQENKKLEFEKLQFESQLILNSIEKSDIEASKKNIKFLIESGFISPKNEKVIGILTDTTFAIQLPKKDTVLITPKNGTVLGPINMLARCWSGKIINSKEKKIEDVNIYINPEIENSPTGVRSYQYSTKTDSNGLFKIILPSEGKNFRILFSKEGFRSQHIIYSNSKYLSYPEKITLIANDEETGFFDRIINPH
jgi:hypothetical protein